MGGMREIKFKIWDKDKNKWLYDYEDITMAIGRMSKYAEEKGWILLQFTGLHDRHGKEIYEGDIVRFADKWEWYRGKFAGGILSTAEDKKEVLTNHKKYPYEIRKVEFNEGGFVFATHSEIREYWEVIGNIYENPELLENKL